MRIRAGKVGDVIQVRVANLAVDPTTSSPVVLLEGIDVKGTIPIWIGQPEANAIIFQLSGQTFERPLTHDLLRIVIEGLEARVSRILITELRGNTFYAKIFLSRGNESCRSMRVRAIRSRWRCAPRHRSSCHASSSSPASRTSRRVPNPKAIPTSSATTIR